jgi:tryptophan synthase alpha chain
MHNAGDRGVTHATDGSARLSDAFDVARADGRIAFIPYVVAGYPDYATSEAIALTALDLGGDILEVGLPYSDPLADGVSLQRASAASLAAGATLGGSLDLVDRVARARPSKRIVVMGYANQFLGPPGVDVVADRLAAAGACGAIVPDLTFDEGRALEQVFAERGLALVYLVAPTTTPERAATIAARSGGFVYCVSLTGVTGARESAPTQLRALVSRIKAVSTLPVAVGFGVSRPAHVRSVAGVGADGVIVGSALVDALGADGRDAESFKVTVRALAGATRVAPAKQLAPLEVA